MVATMGPNAICATCGKARNGDRYAKSWVRGDCFTCYKRKRDNGELPARKPKAPYWDSESMGHFLRFIAEQSESQWWREMLSVPHDWDNKKTIFNESKE